MKRILLPVLAVAVLAAVGIYAVAYVKEQNRVEAEGQEKRGERCQGASHERRGGR